MKNRIAICLLIALIILPFVVAFTATAYGAPQKIKIRAALAPSGLAWYPAAVALHSFINDNSILDITSSSTSGPLTITAGVVQGAFGIGIQGVNSFMSYAYNGWYDFAGKPNKHLRNIVRVGALHISVLTTRKSGIKTFADLKGKKVGWFTASSNVHYDAIMRAYGIDPDKDIRKVNMASMAEAQRELGLGRIHAAGTAILPSKNLLELIEASGGIYFLPVERDVLLLAKKRYPKGMSGFVPGVYMPFIFPPLKIEKPVPTMLNPLGVVCLDSLDEKVAYIYAKTVVENVDKIRKLNPTLRGLNYKKAATNIFEVPYHRGAIRAFKEKGLWTDELEEWQQGFFK